MVEDLEERYVFEEVDEMRSAESSGAGPFFGEKVWGGLVVLTTGAVTLWSAYLFGLEIAAPNTVLLLGLGPNGLGVVLVGLLVTVGMFVAPMAMRRRWAVGERLAASLIALAWIAASGLSATLVVRMNPLGLPGWPLGSPGDPNQTAIVAVILLLVVTSIPAALFPASGSQSPRTASQLAAPTPAVSGMTWSTERLWSVLEQLFERAPGRVDAKTTILADGTIITSQGALADIVDTSKSPISRGLAELQRTGRIEVETNRYETRIKKLPRKPP